jgi:hypothetical protein
LRTRTDDPVPSSGAGTADACLRARPDSHYAEQFVDPLPDIPLHPRRRTLSKLSRKSAFFRDRDGNADGSELMTGTIRWYQNCRGGGSWRLARSVPFGKG